METMKIVLPESIKTFVQKRAAEGNFSSVREYVLELDPGRPAAAARGAPG